MWTACRLGLIHCSLTPIRTDASETSPGFRSNVLTQCTCVCLASTDIERCTGLLLPSAAGVSSRVLFLFYPSTAVNNRQRSSLFLLPVPHSFCSASEPSRDKSNFVWLFSSERKGARSLSPCFLLYPPSRGRARQIFSACFPS